ncbi:DNA-binding Xre family transcriptional regulator [Deinococcus sp. HSC-46F16]|uniref:hypothetical protein n=1 Tax=Deinococcus sp. HSC-46F16 TaxID=2910968 RepID=UPI00209CD76F|nr:hypothetical protein [Deinococcus sp. HSC-46F16]MCP2014793.1 DNA-binding Xre family transcriptional regulator [Deinococcus sp. HSC-46F16]
MGQMRWTLDATLKRYAKNPHALVQASGLAKTTVYSIVNGETTSVELKTLEKLLLGLEQLTGDPMTIEDILKREAPGELDPALHAQLLNAEPFDWEETRKLIPEWTPEEKAENDEFWLEQERDRRGRGDKRSLRLDALWNELSEQDQAQ